MADSPRPHIVLVGLPGAGKSVVGALLAERLGRGFLDFDAEIARREGMRIADIFAARGEIAFRELERALTEELRGRDGMVLSPGGGWVTQAGTVALLRPPALLAWLRVTPATAVRRMGTGLSDRPLLRHPDAVGELDRLLALRREAYEGADVTVDTELLAPQQVVNELARRIG